MESLRSQERRRLIKEPSSALRLFRFLVVGGVNTAFGIGLFAACTFAGFGPQLSLAITTSLGILFNFVTTGRFVFGSRGIRLLPRFIAIYGLTYAGNALALHGLTDLGMSPIPAQILLLPFFVIASFLAMQTFVFRIAGP